MSLFEVPQLPVLQHLIGGKRVEGKSTIPVFNPSTGSKITEQSLASQAEVDLAVLAARDAFKTWRKTTPSERAGMLLKLADKIDTHADELALLEAVDVGKPITTSLAEMPYISDPIRYFAGAIRVTHGTSSGTLGTSLHSRVEREPIGVVGLITPWNFPLLEAVWKIGPALAAGNTLVLKVTRFTPLATSRLFELAGEIFPPGVVNLLVGDSAGGEALVSHPLVSMISLTGATSTGKQVASEAAQTLKRMHLELGGKAPVLVHPDIDIAAAAEYLVGAGFANSGQDCTAACRLIVHEAVYEEFVSEYLTIASGIKVGNALDTTSEMGPLVSQAHMESVEGFIARAKVYGEIALGGHSTDGDGYFVNPTVVLNVEQDSEIIQEEVFGPVVSIQKAKNEDQMLQWANDCQYGLASSVWSNNLNVTARATEELNFGTVWVNTHLQIFPEAPFGGFGNSGYGKELSLMAIDDYSRFKHIVTQYSY